jgi:nucleotide-binding universal stress UspA family protein
MFEHVIVSVDGGTETRAVLAPAADLAWRCGAKLVVVTTAPSAARSSRDLLKAHAMARSGADIDHWVDPGGDPGAAILETVAHRSTPIVCLATRPRRGGLLRRGGTTALPVEVLRRCPVPLLVVGPETDVARGLPLGELYVPVDGGEAARRAALLAGTLAGALRMAVRLLVLVPPTVTDPRPPEAVRALHQEVARLAPECSCEVVQTTRPAAALVAISSTGTAVVVCPEVGADRRGTLGPFAAEVVATSPQAVLFPPPGA